MLQEGLKCNDCKHGMFGSGRVSFDEKYSQNPCNKCNGVLFEQIKEKKPYNNCCDDYSKYLH